MADASIESYQLLVRALSEQDGGGYFAEVIDLPGCGVDGDTPEEAVANCRKALGMVLRSYAERGKPIPAPGDYSDESFSGRFVLRMPRSLHQRLTLRARAEGVSLNHLCSNLLAEYVTSQAEDKAIRASYEVLEGWAQTLDEGRDEVAWLNQVIRTGVSRSLKSSSGLSRGTRGRRGTRN